MVDVVRLVVVDDLVVVVDVVLTVEVDSVVVEVKLVWNNFVVTGCGVIDVDVVVVVVVDVVKGVVFGVVVVVVDVVEEELGEVITNTRESFLPPRSGILMRGFFLITT